MQIHRFYEVVLNLPIRAAFIGWLIAQLLKVPIHYFVTKKIDWSRAKGSGGMPSSHSAAIVAATTAIGMTEGFSSGIFALALVMSTIVMYDAAGVRRAAGNQAKVINELREVILKHKQVSDKQLKEWIGHTPFEVLVGAILGIVVGITTTIIAYGVYNVFKII